MAKAARHLRLSIVILGLGLLGLAGAAYLMTPGATRLPTVAIGGPFVLNDGNGRVVTDRDMKGRPFLVFFGYTHCPDICPTSLFEISQVLKTMGPDKKISVLFVTVDPARDTPAVMKDYVADFDPRIIGLSGDPAHIEAVEKAYRVYAKKAPASGSGDYAMDHTAIVYLMDKDGRFVNAFNLERPPEAAAQELEKYL